MVASLIPRGFPWLPLSIQTGLQALPWPRSSAVPVPGGSSPPCSRPAPGGAAALQAHAGWGGGRLPGQMMASSKVTLLARTSSRACCRRRVWKLLAWGRGREQSRAERVGPAAGTARGHGVGTWGGDTAWQGCSPSGIGVLGHEKGVPGLLGGSQRGARGSPIPVGWGQGRPLCCPCGRHCWLDVPGLGVLPSATPQHAEPPDIWGDISTICLGDTGVPGWGCSFCHPQHNELSKTWGT